MTRPLLVTDCDEVLLHMVAHFRDWLLETHDLHFAMEEENWNEALVRRATGDRLPAAEVLPFLHGFFENGMERQTLVTGAAEALERLSADADILILTSLADHCRAARVAQLNSHGLFYDASFSNGSKGAALAAIIEARLPSVTVFVDDLASQHASVVQHRPEVWRLQMIAEPRLALHRARAPHAHARIDDWGAAVDWILARFADGPAPQSVAD